MVIIVIVVLLAIVMASINALVIQSWRQDRQQLGRLADQLAAEARIQTHTVQTLQQMRDVARSWPKDGR